MLQFGSLFLVGSQRPLARRGAGGILNRNCCPRLRPLVAGEKRGSDGIQEKCRGEPVGVREGGEGGGAAGSDHGMPIFHSPHNSGP